MTAAVKLTFGELIETLGFTDGEFVSICHQPVHGSFSSSVVKANSACAQVASLPERSCTWFSVNPVEGPERHGRGRGRERDVTRWAALYLDLDIKPGAFESQEQAWEFINAMSTLIGTAPTAVGHSGHGLQPLWAITDGRLTDENGEFAEVAWSRAHRLTRVFGRFAARVAAESFGVKLDTVSDLSRVLRVPDTTNWKDPDHPAATWAVLGTGAPLADMDAIEEFLDRWSAVEVESDHPVSGEVFSAPEGWQYGETTCPYVLAMVTAWSEDSDKPKGGRHQWAMNRAVRLACAHRLGCVNEAGLIASLQYLEAALAYWCQRVGVGRSLHPNEISDAYRWAVDKVSTFDDDRTRRELGYHKHQADTDTAGEAPGGFEEPIPLVGNVVEVPPFPTDALPPVFARKVTELAEATQTDPAMAGTTALSVCSACTAGHARIQIRPGWIEPLCLYTNTIAEPAERKSAVQASMVAPLRVAEADLSVAGELRRQEQQDDLEMAKKNVDRLNKDAVDAAARAAHPKFKKDATEAEKQKTREEATEAATQAAEAAREAKRAMRAITVPVTPRILADDATPEATQSLLADHGGRIAIISTEGGIFDTMAGRYARTVNIDVYLKGHSGDPIRVDRQGRSPQYIPSPALTIGLMVQPWIIETIAANRDFVGRGLLARFLYAQPVSRVGSRAIGATPVSKTVEDDYCCLVKKLASDMAGWAGDPATVYLSPEAEAEVRRIEGEVEPTLANGGTLASPLTLTAWGGKYAGAVVRIAGLLHLAECGEPGLRIPLAAKTIRAAGRLGDYYKASAINVFARMANPNIADAIYLLDRIVLLDKTEVSEREVFRAASRFPTVADMRAGLERLIEHGYLIRVEQDKKSTGGRPSLRYRVHPDSANAVDDARGWSE
jgi:hypothetical protein